MKSIKIDKKVLVILFFFCLALSFLMCFSPLGQGFGHGYDSAIYATVGNALNKGRVLYTQIVDNKGPLMYFINSLGLLINYKFGIFLIEFIFLFIGSMFGYKTAMIITKNNKFTSCFSVIFSMLLLLYTLDGGNFTEEYAILFTNIATYYVVKFLTEDYLLKKYELMLIGGCFAATFLLRANLCAFFVCQVLVILFYLLKDKKYKVLFNCILYIIIGAFIVLLPVLIYLLVTKSFTACLNLVYFGVIDSFATPSLMERFTKVVGLIEIANQAHIFTIFALAFILFLTKPNIEKSLRKIMIIAFFAVILNTYVNSLTGGQAWAYAHYYISFVPIAIVISSWLFSYVYDCFDKEKLTNNLKKLLLIFGCFAIISNQTVDLFVTICQRFNYKEPAPSSIEKYIADNSSDTDTIQMIGVNDTIYYPTNRIPTSRHLYFVAGFSEERRRKDANELATDLYDADQQAKIIMLSSGELQDNVFVNSLSDKQKFLDYLYTNYTYDESASLEFNCNVYLLKS